MSECGKDVELPRNNIEIRDMVQTDPKVIEAARVAVTMVLQENLGSVGDLTLVFVDRINNPVTNILMPYPAETFPDGKTIVLAMGSPFMKDWIQNFGPISSMLLMSAHEAKHVVQIRQGDPPPFSASLSAEDYTNEPHEIDAWNEALHLFKKIRTEASGSFVTSGRKFTVPEESRYKQETSQLPDYIRGQKGY